MSRAVHSPSNCRSPAESTRARRCSSEAAAAILADEGRFDGPTPPLTGDELLDFADLAKLASEILEKPVGRETIADAALEAKMLARNVPAKIAAIAIGYYLASRAGEFAKTDPTLEQLIGRKPTPMRDVMTALLKH